MVIEKSKYLSKLELDESCHYVIFTSEFRWKHWNIEQKSCRSRKNRAKLQRVEELELRRILNKLWRNKHFQHNLHHEVCSVIWSYLEFWKSNWDKVIWKMKAKKEILPLELFNCDAYRLGATMCHSATQKLA